jgi:exodeoxyribonuclease VII large subunit
MQGAQAEESIIEAFNLIYDKCQQFDAVAVIRGGGATSDLNCFDSYLLAANCAQFPLPVITGIGHEKDNSVLDIVAHTRVKTPTAAASFLLDSVLGAEAKLITAETGIFRQVNNRLLTERNRLLTYSSSLSIHVNRLCMTHKSRIDKVAQQLPNALNSYFSRQQHQLELAEKTLELAAPENILKKGYSLTLKNGKIIKSASLLSAGDEISTRFSDGSTVSIVKKVNV